MTTTSTTSREWEIAASVLDPEVPVLTIEDLGILRSVRIVRCWPWENA